MHNCSRLAACVFCVFANVVWAGECSFDLTSDEQESGSAHVRIDGRDVDIYINDAARGALYTVWIDFRNRGSREVSSDYPLDAGALPRGVAPLFSTTAGVTSGMGFDPNSIVTDSSGDGRLDVTVDFELLRKADSPVVGEMLAMQGQNRVGGGWLRVYPTDANVAASLQTVDLRTGLPLVQRATAQGLTIVAHPDLVSHGHTPGVGQVDHFPGFFADFPQECYESDEMSLVVSSSSGRDAERPLNGVDVVGESFIYVAQGDREDIDKVDFFVDGHYVHTEFTTPFDLVGTRKDGGAKAFDSRVLENGEHELKARVRFESGYVEELATSFTANNGDLQIAVSESGNRMRAMPLAGAHVSGDVFVFITPLKPESVARVEFYLDGAFVKTEKYSPYDLKGTKRSGDPAALNLAGLSRGQHYVQARVVPEHHRDAYGVGIELYAEFFVE